MNFITTSEGERITRKVFDHRIERAKREAKNYHKENYEYLFCTHCNRNDDKPVDAAHEISVDKCIKMGKPELAYSVHNIIILGRKCHEKHDKLNLQFNL